MILLILLLPEDGSSNTILQSLKPYSAKFFNILIVFSLIVIVTKVEFLSPDDGSDNFSNYQLSYAFAVLKV